MMANERIGYALGSRSGNSPRRPIWSRCGVTALASVQELGFGRLELSVSQRPVSAHGHEPF
jgi:hypothetical protein